MKKILLAFILIFLNDDLSAYTKDKVYKLTVLHTNDHHGAFWSNRDSEGGLAARATLIKKIKKEVLKQGGYTLLIDAGDVNTGTPQSNLLEAKADFLGMRQLGYEAMTIGNHEFDKSQKILKQQQNWAGFPFLSANIFKKDCKQNAFTPFTSKKRGPLTVTILGLTTEESIVQSNPLNTSHYCFLPAIDVAKRLVPQLRKKSDILIALTHIGYAFDDSRPSGDSLLAREVEGIDLIVGGHSHSLLETPDIQNKTPIVQVQDNGKYLGRVDLEFINGRTLVKKYEAISINKKDDIVRLAPDKKVLELLRPYYEKGNKYLLKEIGDTDEDFVGERDIVRTQSTNLGQLITYAYREVYQADVAIVNSGGIRSSLKKGKITYEDVLKVLPFGGEVVLAELMGNELRDYLEFVLINMLPLSGGFPQLIGAEAIVDPVIKKLSKLLINGESIMSEKKYKIALPEFLALGGDHYPKINAKRYGKIDSIILKDYIAKKKHLTSADFSLKNQSTAK